VQEGGAASTVAATSLRERRCLLKGCERAYRPSHPQSRYCSEECRREACRWRRWRASRTWRASELGKERRQEQSRRYRRRIPLVVVDAEPVADSEPMEVSADEPTDEPASPASASPASASPVSASPASASPASASPALTDAIEINGREGQRAATKPEDFQVRVCARPGCYERFAVNGEWSARRFCSSLCRRALRRVLDREARYRRRRRAGFRPRRRQARSPPPPCL